MKSYFEPEDLTFAVCAYKKSIYLEACVKSVLNQAAKGNVCIATSTPNEYIDKIAAKYQVPVYVNPKSEGIAADWNFAVGCAKTSLVTLAHQDDIYEYNYSEQILKSLNCAKKPLLAFSDYSEIRDGTTVNRSRLLTVKRILLLPLRLRVFWNSKFIRRRILSFGNAICCPAVTLVKKNLHLPLFKNNMRSNIDWQAWEEISRLNGAFVYVPQSLMKHRIHGESTTSGLLEVNGRQPEDMYMFRKFWPGWLAGVIDWFYRSNEKGNQVK